MCGWYRSYALKYSKWSDILTESDLLAAKDGKAAKAGLCSLATCECWVWCPVAKQIAFLWGKRWEQKDTLRKASRERTSLSLQILSNRHGKRTLESLCPLLSLEPTRQCFQCFLSASFVDPNLFSLAFYIFHEAFWSFSRSLKVFANWLLVTFSWQPICHWSAEILVYVSLIVAALPFCGLFRFLFRYTPEV